MYEYFGNVTSTRLRSVLVSQVLKKNLRLPASKAFEAGALTHISADVEGILGIIRAIHELWIGIIGLGIGLYILWTLVGTAFFFPLVPIVGMLLDTLEIAKYETNYFSSINYHWLVRGQAYGSSYCGLEPSDPRSNLGRICHHFTDHWN